MQQKNMRHRVKEVDQLLEGDEPLDEDEQAKVVALMATEAATQERQWRIIFAVLSLILAAGFLYLGARQILQPWDMRHHAAFAGVIGAWVVALGELTAAASIGWTGVIMLQGRDKNGRKTPGAKYTWPLAVGACLLLFWGTLLALAVMGGDLRLSSSWHNLWLPLGPLAFSLVCWSVDVMLEDYKRDVSQLGRLKYQCKTL